MFVVVYGWKIGCADIEADKGYPTTEYQQKVKNCDIEDFSSQFMQRLQVLDFRIQVLGPLFLAGRHFGSLRAERHKGFSIVNRLYLALCLDVYRLTKYFQLYIIKVCSACMIPYRHKVCLG